MFPLVPYHALPRLHDAVKDDCPPPIRAARRMARDFPAALRQVKDPAYYVKRHLPEPKPRVDERLASRCAEPDAEGWVQICAAAHLGRADALRFDHGQKTYALYPRRRRNGSSRPTESAPTATPTSLTA